MSLGTSSESVTVAENRGSTQISEQAKNQILRAFQGKIAMSLRRLDQISNFLNLYGNRHIHACTQKPKLQSYVGKHDQYVHSARAAGNPRTQLLYKLAIKMDVLTPGRTPQDLPYGCFPDFILNMTPANVQVNCHVMLA